MDTDQNFEIAVLGAGISGLGVALEACKRGKRVCIIDKAQSGLATSNNSLRIIHGGLRYLQKLDFPRIVSSLADQSYCLKKWPELIKPLRCVAPLSGKGLKRATLVRMASILYSCFLGALNSPLERPYVDSRNNLESLPFLTGLAPHGFLIWQDALLLDHRALVASLIAQIKELGGCILEESKVVAANDSGKGVDVIVLLKDGREQALHARHAVNCLGAWISQIKNPLPNKWCLGFNLILKRQFSPDLAFGCDGEQGRYFFFVPREDKTVLGTGYVLLQNPSDEAKPGASQIEEFILCASRAAPRLELSVDDIESVEFGILPMKELNSKGQPELFGSSQITKIGNMVHVLSTKYTTFRSQALEILDLIEK